MTRLYRVLIDASIVFVPRTAFPSLKKFETEVVAMTASLLGGDEQVVGNMTTGDTDSLLMTVKTAREYAREVENASGRR